MNLMLFTLLGNILCIPCRMNNGRKNGKIISLFDLFHSHGDLDYYFYNSSESSDYEDYHNEAATTKEIELTSKKVYELPTTAPIPLSTTKPDEKTIPNYNHSTASETDVDTAIKNAENKPTKPMNTKTTPMLKEKTTTVGLGTTQKFKEEATTVGLGTSPEVKLFPDNEIEISDEYQTTYKDILLEDLKLLSLEDREKKDICDNLKPKIFYPMNSRLRNKRSFDELTNLKSEKEIEESGEAPATIIHEVSDANIRNLDEDPEAEWIDFKRMEILNSSRENNVNFFLTTDSYEVPKLVDQDEDPEADWDNFDERETLLKNNSSKPGIVDPVSIYYPNTTQYSSPDNAISSSELNSYLIPVGLTAAFGLVFVILFCCLFYITRYLYKKIFKKPEHTTDMLEGSLREISTTTEINQPSSSNNMNSVELFAYEDKASNDDTIPKYKDMSDNHLIFSNKTE